MYSLIEEISLSFLNMIEFTLIKHLSNKFLQILSFNKSRKRIIRENK